MRLKLNAVEAVKSDLKSGKLTIDQSKDPVEYKMKRYVSIEEEENGYQIRTNSKTYVATTKKEALEAAKEILNA